MLDLIIEFLPVYAICGAYCLWCWRVVNRG